MKSISLDQLADAAVAGLSLGISYEQEMCDQFVRNTFARAGGDMGRFAGSNDMFRRACSKIIPLRDAIRTGELRRGWLLFIRDFDGREPKQYQGDGMGNAWHVGIYTGPGDPEVVHSSETRGGVAKSTLKNAWNMAGPPLAAMAEGDDQDVSLADSIPQDTGADNLLRIRRGHPLMTGHYVLDLQHRLNGMGYPVYIDGIYGRETEAAVKRYQSDRGLDADGIVGPLTWAALRGEGHTSPPGDAAQTYTATLHDLTDAQVSALLMDFPDAIITQN